MSSSKSSEYVGFFGEVFTSDIAAAIPAPGVGNALKVVSLELQLVGGTTTVRLYDGTNEVGSRKLAADAVWYSDIPRRLAENQALQIKGSGASLSLYGTIRYQIETIGT